MSRRTRLHGVLKAVLAPLDEAQTPRRWKFADITLDMLDRGGITVVCLSIVGGAIAGDILQINALWGMVAGIAVLALVVYGKLKLYMTRADRPGDGNDLLYHADRHGNDRRATGRLDRPDRKGSKTARRSPRQ